MLRIGNRAFTFVEVMVAVAILSLTAILVYESFFTSLDLFNYYSDYLFASLRMDELFWQAQDSLIRLGPAAQLDREGEFANAGKRFSWNLSYGPVGSVEGLYKIDLVTLLKTGHRMRRLTRSGYAKYEAK
jgi:prepilin-type N-terminal cleavage/methylation domain-containing protein